MMTVAAINAAIRIQSADGDARRAALRSTGPTTSAPRASPIHHADHRLPKRSQGWTAAAHDDTTPIVALIVVTASAPKTMNRVASLRRAKAGSKERSEERRVGKECRSR